MRQIAKQFYKQTRNFGFIFQKYNVGSCHLVRELGKVSSDRFHVPDHIDKPFYYETQGSSKTDTIGDIEIKNSEQIQRMRESCKLAANILKLCGEKIEVRMSFFNAENISSIFSKSKSPFVGRNDYRRYR